ncbi:hypothetical protein XU18_1324 [Perkinsela sp. CCAP 1560/4]|nr:hypothetical protein XU18_1324 [Perkinsela sp. CCAP 1560/4]|eukprot:KNH08108.1 hypothetical protein XU18_1324 [Perkinsela sp. CCAP 1560/4]
MAISRWWVGLVPVQSLIQRKLLGEDRNRQIRRSEDPGTGPWHVSGGGVSPEHIHHHRDKTLALVASTICIGTCSENSRSSRIKFAWHMFNTLFLAQWTSPSSHKDLNNWICQTVYFLLTRRKATSSWWIGPVPQFWGKPRTFSNPSSCFCHGADLIDGRRKVVGQDPYPSMGRFRRPPFLAMGDPGSSWWRDERKSTHSLWIKARDAMSPHE